VGCQAAMRIAREMAAGFESLYKLSFLIYFDINFPYF
jgi:hypothetical protein